MSHNTSTYPELAPGIIEKYSSYIAEHKPRTLASYFYPSCLQCYFGDPHPAHTQPATLIELHTFIQASHAHLSALSDQHNQHYHVNLIMHQDRLAAYGEAELPLEAEIRRIDQRAETEAAELAVRKATLMSRGEFEYENARMDEGKERREEAKERIKANWDVLKADLENWYKKANWVEKAWQVEHRDKVEREEDALTCAQVLLDEKIEWVRKTFEGLNKLGMELPFPL